MESLPYLHFDLSHLADVADEPLFLKIDGKTFPLSVHNPTSLDEGAKLNSAVRRMRLHSPGSLTHFADLSATLLPRNKLTRIEVVGYADPNDPYNYLPPLYYVSFAVHPNAMHRYAKTLLKRKMPLTSSLAQRYGWEEQDTNLSIEHLMDEFAVRGPLDVAIHLVSQHPMLSSNKESTLLTLANEHIYPRLKDDPDSIQQCNDILFLADAIRRQGKDGFARVAQATDGKGDAMEFDFEVGQRKKGDRVLTYELTEETEHALAPAIAKPLQSSRDDIKLRNQTWSVNQGETSHNLEGPDTKTLQKSAINAAVGGEWSISPDSSTHGIKVDASSLSLDSDNNFSIDAYNRFLRIVGAYITFYEDSEMTKPMNNPMSGSMLKAFQSDTKTYLSMLTTVNTIMGIPMPSDPVKLKTAWPAAAQAASLQFGGIGTWNYDKNIVWPGFIQTGIFCFGVPSIMMAAGAAVTSTKWFKEFVDDTDNIVAAAAVAFGVAPAALAVDIAFIQGLKKSLFTFGNILAGLLVKKGFEKLSAVIIEKVTVAQFTNALPYVGWGLRIANMALNVSQMAVTLGEVLSSPAVIKVDIKRRMKFTFNLHPDPKHGEAGRPETAIWPAVGHHYKFQINYRQGTGFSRQGEVPRSPDGGVSNQPISISGSIPWGGEMQLIAAVYSRQGWLCGKYQSEWMAAVPDDIQTGLKKIDGHITEVLVPLSKNTQYHFDQKIAYTKDKGHYWWGSTAGAKPPVETISDLNPSNVGANIAQLAGISINQSAYVIGYTWQGSEEKVPLENGKSIDTGQQFVFQTLSVLAEPQSRRKFPAFGFKTKPAIALDTFGGNDKEIGGLNFVVDTRGATAGHVRKINIFDGTDTFELDNKQSFGVFTLADIDDMAVHPGGHLVAVNWKQHKMQVLTLASEPVQDELAPQAKLVSSKGIQQGLLSGPKALSIGPDGRIYILESLNERIQTFDLAGNPVASFKGEHLFNVGNAAAMITQLDGKTAPEALLEMFVTQGVQQLFVLDGSFGNALDKGELAQGLIDEFADHMEYLTIEADKEAQRSGSYVTVIEPGHSWKIMDTGREQTYALNLANDQGIAVLSPIEQTEVLVLKAGESWQLKDLKKGESYLLEHIEGQLSVSRYVSFFGINPKNERLAYCDLAIESKGYIYALSYIVPEDGLAVDHTAYRLDVYTPDGIHLFRTPDGNLTAEEEMEYVSAGKISLDLWRNLFTLNYEKLAGPDGRTEPSISQWVPTPPLFDLPTDNDTVGLLNGENTADIIPLFKAHDIALSEKAVVKTIQKNLNWQIVDNQSVYDAIVVAGQINVYAIKSTN